jgi:hypothetical protein
MNIIENALEPTNGYVFMMKRNTIEGWWELEVGIPNNWVFSENKDINCEILNESNGGKLILVSPKNHNICIDDLYYFVELIILTNEKIAKKEKEFTDKMNEMKNVLEKEAKNFYAELDILKENSFNDLKKNKVIEKKKVRTKKDGTDVLTPITNTNTEETITK